MKRYSIFCILAALCWFATSCDDFLKEKPRDTQPEEEGYRNISELYLNAVASLTTMLVVTLIARVCREQAAVYTI